MQARFLVLEGVDGSGKTTQAEALVAWLRAAGRDPVHLREPGTTVLGERLREILLDPARPAGDPREEALLFFAARAALLREEVGPALAAGRDVLCERFTPSTLAYQGSDPVLRQFILRLDELVVGDRQPDLVLILDLPVAESLARARSRSAEQSLDGMEARGANFLHAVRDGYLRYAAARADRSVLVDASGGTPEVVQARLRAALAERFPSWAPQERSLP